ncbi:hypothetical protein MNBD_GAMMA06-1854 [hydrothermal vent metagenome]|uniref:histidine kinase n=1 Tax=hydrothermal vent metagenome TaxID=652676 RepID=A0A3B0WFT7_9ZZZZ
MIEKNSVWQKKVSAEQVRIVYRQIPVFMYGGIAASLMIAVLFWAHISQPLLISWVVVIAILNLGLLLPLQIIYQRSKPTDEEMKKWGIIITFGFGICVGAWGLSGALFYLPEVFEYQLILNLFVLGSSAVIMIATSSYQPVYHATCIPILFPLFTEFILHGDLLHWALAAGLFLYWVTLTVGYRRVNQAMVKSLVLGYQNQQLVEQVTQQKEVAVQADIAKSRFLAAASHDLRQPLQAQTLFVEELYGQLHDPEKSRKILARLDDSINAMRGLFNALLDISKLDAGVVQAKIKDFNIAGILNIIKDEYAPQAKEKGLALKLHCRDVVVRSDPGLLDSVLRNLVVNSIRYSQSGKVLIGCRLRSKYLSIEVWDTGQGIAKKHQQDIFQEFFQIENQQRDRDQGLGLGLSVVRRVAKLLDCPIRVDSVEGKGSRFTIDVPLGDRAAVLVDSEIKQQASKHVLDGIHVLVVDDEPAIQQAMQGVLTSWGCQVFIAQSGEEILFKLDDNDFPPDIIIADYRLPGSMTGVQTVQQVRDFFKTDIPAILITGDIETNKLQDVQQSAIPLLHKPVQPGKLRTLMHHLLTDVD